MRIYTIAINEEQLKVIRNALAHTANPKTDEFGFNISESLENMIADVLKEGYNPPFDTVHGFTL